MLRLIISLLSFNSFILNIWMQKGYKEKGTLSWVKAVVMKEFCRAGGIATWLSGGRGRSRAQNTLEFGGTYCVSVWREGMKGEDM